MARSLDAHVPRSSDLTPLISCAASRQSNSFSSVPGQPDPATDLNDDNAPSVVRICQRVDGIPLAIELVAARVRSMSVPAIDERMADQFNLVSAGNRVSMARQRTLRATFDWSHALLTEAEKRVFRRLSVFAGGFTLDAAEAACSGGDAEGTNQSHLESITSLVDKSLVISLEGTREAGRNRLLEPIRQYAHERLSEVHEADAARGSDARFFLDLGDEAYRELRGPNQVAWMARVVSELDNFRACFDWSLEHAPPAALQLAVALERYWISNSAVEGLQLLEAALAASQAQDELHAHGLCRASNLATSLWQFDRARQFGDDCLALAQQLGSDLYVGLALSALASVGYQERREGWVAVSLSRLERAEPHVRLANDAEALARLLNNYGWFLYLAGDSLRARPKVEEALSLASGRDDTWMVTGVLDSLANIEFAAGNIERAEAHWKHAATLAGQLGLRASQRRLDWPCPHGDAASLRERCLRMLAAAKGLLSAAGASMETGQALEFVADKDAAWALLDRNKAELAWSEGAQMTLLSAVLYAVDYRMPGEPRVSASGSDGGENSPQNAKAFIREGEFWSLTYDGVVARLRDSKGLRDIARLLETPCREVAAVDLAGGELVDMARRSATVGELGLGVEGDVGEALDAEARSEYRARLFDLDEEIAGAERDNDPERASQAGEEREFLLSELGAAVGLGGRAHRVLDPAERARKAFTGRIRTPSATSRRRIRPWAGTCAVRFVRGASVSMTLRSRSTGSCSGGGRKVPDRICHCYPCSGASRLEGRPAEKGAVTRERGMTTRTDTQGSTKLADADVDELTKLGSSVGELERDAMAQSWNLRALGKIVIQASRRADAYARLDAALARHM